jgi:adenylate cyclase
MNGYNPDYYAVIGKNYSVEESSHLLSVDSKEGLFSLFNLLNIARKSKTDKEAEDNIRYVGKVVINIYFKGLLNTFDADTIFEGFASELIDKKQKMSIEGGGAPWM